MNVRPEKLQYVVPTLPNILGKIENEAAKVLATDLSNGPSYQGYVGAEDSPLLCNL